MVHRAIELGALAATACERSAGCPKLASVLSDAPPDESKPSWVLLSAESAANSITLLAIDVEMIERRSDKLRLPVTAALVRCEIPEGNDAPTTSTLFSGFVDPSSVDAGWASGDAAAWDYKEQFTGFTHADLLARRDAGEMTPLSQLQRRIKDAMHAGAFLVGHGIQCDLRCLRLHGAALRRRVVDTMWIFRTMGGGSAPLKDLVAEMLAEVGDWADFQKGAHGALRDAEAALALVLRELRLLVEQRGHRVGTWSGGERCKRYRVLESDAGKIIGRQGAKINELRAKSGAEVKLHERRSSSPVRVLEIRGEAEAVSCAERLMREMHGNIHMRAL